MSPTEQKVIEALLQGDTVWFYSDSAYGYIVHKDGPVNQEAIRIRRTTLNNLEERGLIEEDISKRIEREASGSDIHYRLTASSQGIYTVNVNYVLSLSTEELKALRGWATELGYGTHRPPSVWLRQVFQENGTDALIRAKEWNEVSQGMKEGA